MGRIVRAQVGGLVDCGAKDTWCEAAQKELHGGHARADHAYVGFEDGHVADGDIVPCVMGQHHVDD